MAFCEVLVEAERTSDGAGDLCDLERMRETRAVVIALGRQEHLRLVREAPERLAVEDSVAVALELSAQRIEFKRPFPPACLVRERRPMRQARVFLGLRFDA